MSTFDDLRLIWTPIRNAAQTHVWRKHVKGHETVSHCLLTVSRSCCAPSAICTQAVYLTNSWTQEQKRNRENTWSTAGLFCIYAISRIPRRCWPRCSWHTRHQNQMELTPTPMGHQDPTNWCLRRSRATSYSLVTPDVQGKRNHDHAQWARPRPTLRGFSIHMRLPVPEITVPSAATLGQPTAWPSISRICQGKSTTLLSTRLRRKNWDI